MTIPNSGGYLVLPKPPSTNTLYINLPKRGRAKTERYRTWIRAAEAELWTQPKWTVTGPCILDLTVEKRGATKEDISNRIKSVEDFLVEQGFISDDRNVDEVRARWAAKGTVTGCQVRVWSVMEDAA